MVYVPDKLKKDGWMLVLMALQCSDCGSVLERS